MKDLVALRYDDIFNDETLNIFTDASITKKYWTEGTETIGCAGAYSTSTKCQFNPVTSIIRHSTNNNSEISAIYLGILEALRLRNDFKYINIFSDSKISIFGLREWIFNWTKKVDNGIMYSSSGTPVANQEIFLKIIYTILNNDLKINFFHINGHINPNNMIQIKEAMKTFVESNNITIKVENEIIRQIAIYNDFIDNYTRNQLDFVMEPISVPTPFIKFGYNNFDTKKYSQLIGG